MSFFELVGAFLIGSFLAGVAVRILFGKSHKLQKGLLREGYNQGYWDASVNLKMYYSLMDKTMPPSDWLRYVMGRRLSTREEFMVLMNTDELMGWTLK